LQSFKSRVAPIFGLANENRPQCGRFMTLGMLPDASAVERAECGLVPFWRFPVACPVSGRGGPK
jgi:hypothetical protein